MAEVSIVDYGIGNIGSITNMFRKLRVESEIVSSRASLLGAKRLILPGIGAFDACMRALDNSGLRAAVLEFADRRSGKCWAFASACKCWLSTARRATCPVLG